MTLNLCLDFGTAFSKASAWTTDSNRPMPLRIGEAVGYGGYTVPTAVLITSERRMYFGQDAINESRASGVPVFSDLKRYVTRQNTPLDEVGLPNEYNPTRFNLTVRQVISLYMAFLSFASTDALGNVAADGIRRTLTMPVFAGRQGKHLRRELRLAAQCGWEMKDVFGDAWNEGLDIRAALQRLRPLERRANSRPDDGAELVEPLAAIAARMATYSPDKERRRRLSFVIDVGAGTVDFGLFVSGLPQENIGVHPIANAKYSLPVGGNDIDSALVDYVLEKATLGYSGRAELRAALSDERARVHKENLLGLADDEDMLVEGVRLTRKEFLSSKPLRRVAERIEAEFEKRLRSVHASWFELASSLTRMGIGVFLTGGGANLPFLREMIRENAPRAVNGSPQFYLRVARERPTWATEPGFARTWRRIARDFPQMAVSLGGAVYGARVNQYLTFESELGEWAGATRR